MPIPMAYGRKSESTTQPTSYAMPSGSQASAAQQSSTSFGKSRVFPPYLVLASAPPDNRTVKDEFATSPSPSLDQAAALQQPTFVSSGPFPCKKSRCLSSSLAATNAITDARSIMDEDEYVTSSPVSRPQIASSWQATSTWSSLGEDCRATLFSFASTNAFFSR
jgi:uncharacterized protein YciI